MVNSNHISSYKAKGRTLYKVTFTLMGFRIRRSNLTKVEAETFYHKVRTDILSGNYKEDNAEYATQSFKTISQFINDYLQYLRTQTSLRGSSIRVERLVLARLAEVMGKGRKLKGLKSRSFCRAFERLATSRKLAYNTKKGYRIKINKLIKWGIKKAYLQHTDLIDGIKGKRQKAEKKEFFTRAELTDLFSEFNRKDKKEDYYYRFFFTQFQLALRVKEVPAIKAEDINFNENSIHISRTFSSQAYGNGTTVSPTKNGKSAVLPISPELKEVLKEQIAFRAQYHPESEFLFHGVNGKRFDYTAHNNKLKAVTKRAGIKGKVSTHIMRKSWVCFGMEAGIPIPMLAQFSRHTPQVLLETYTEVKSHLFYSTFRGYSALNEGLVQARKDNKKTQLLEGELEEVRN